MKTINSLQVTVAYFIRIIIYRPGTKSHALSGVHIPIVVIRESGLTITELKLLLSMFIKRTFLFISARCLQVKLRMMIVAQS